MPSFRHPQLTHPAAEVLAEAEVTPPAADPLPTLSEPSALPPVLDSSTEPLVEVGHDRIAIVDCYALAGWEHAHGGAWLRASATDRLTRAAASLPERWGLCVFDAWRPLALQAELYEAVYADASFPPGYVSYPDPDPQAPPPHLTGGTVDCSLTLDGVPLALGTGFDDFTPRAHSSALEHEHCVERDLRRLLFWTMHRVGFVMLSCEWWHFEYGTRRWAAITENRPLYGPTHP